MSGPNTIDYSNLNKSLQPKNVNIGEIKKNTVEAIGKVFLESNNLVISEDMNADKVKRRNERLNRFASSIETASDGMKSSFIITINYLVENGLMGTEKIKSLHLTELENNLDGDNANKDTKLQNILDELTKGLSETEKIKLDKHVNMELINLNKNNLNSSKLLEKISNLKQQNADLQADVDAMNAGFDIMEEGSRSKWSFANLGRVANAIRVLNENKDGRMSQEDVTRYVLWQADKHVIWGTSKSISIFNSPLKMDINAQYNKVSEKLNEKLQSAKGQDWLNIRRIQLEVNKAHDNYLAEIPEDTKKANLRKIDLAMGNSR